MNSKKTKKRREAKDAKQRKGSLREKKNDKTRTSVFLRI